MAETTKKQRKPEEILEDFVVQVSTLEKTEHHGKLFLITDKRTLARFCECHVKASDLVKYGTVDAVLDDDEENYRANRDVVENHAAFRAMKEDAKHGRVFSNIVAEYTTDYDEDHPIKIIGGQHRFEAIKEALANGVDEYHGLKVYIGLNVEQRLDVQLISNTNIAVSSDLFDRMQEHVRGPALRNWCQEVGFLKPDQDFADRREKGGAITVQQARTFITNYYEGKKIPDVKFDVLSTTPVICPSGQHDDIWIALAKQHKDFNKETKLKDAAKEFVRLADAQRKAFNNTKAKANQSEKVFTLAVLSAWAYAAGVLWNNDIRLKRHCSLSDTKGRDPLNAQELAKYKHKTDQPNYRGVGTRSDARERGRMLELFWYQAESACGITKTSIDVAVKKHIAKLAHLEVLRAEGK